MASKYANLDEYYAALDAGKVDLMKRVFDLVMAEFPDMKAKIAWNQPVLYLDGAKFGGSINYVSAMDSATNWLLYNPFSPAIMTEFADRLSGYHTGTRTIRIPLDWEPDRELLIDLTKARLAEIEREIVAKTAGLKG